MRFAFFEFAGKERYFKQRLYEFGHEEARAESGEFTTDFDVLLVDCDWPWAYPRPILIDGAKKFGAKVVMYPHAGRPTVWVYDGIAEPDDRVDLRLEHGAGSLLMAGHFMANHLPLNQHATGWLFSPTAEFEPVENPKRILFAPLHPNIEMMVKGGNGHDPAPKLNQEIYRRLLELRGVDEIIVSLAGPTWRHGVWPHPRVRFTDNPMMRFEHSYEQIRNADVVVAAGTMAAAAVALGKPTVMFAQSDFQDYVNGEYIQAEHQDLYRDLARYPLDTQDDDLWKLIVRACEKERTSWRDMWVGTDGTEAAIGLLENLVNEEREGNNVTIQGATARSMSRS
jgi:hypothetical protein